MPPIPEIHDSRDVFAKLMPAGDVERSATPEHLNQPGYYGLPILKRPFWKWEIALYFFFEGISAGSHVLCSIAQLTRNEKYDTIVRQGRYLSFFTMMLCPPLLIADLGRPERFHHMLRIWKKTSPMNHGAWALTGFGIVSSLQLALVWPATRMPFGRALLRLLVRVLPEPLVILLGLPFALAMISYPGVLLETTANPLWSRSNYLGPLFAASSMSNAAAALTLLNRGAKGHELHHRLGRFEDISTAAEAAALGLYVGTSRKAARPLFKGKQKKLFLFGAIGLGMIVPAILRRSRSPVLRNVVAPLLTLAGGAALKWSITYAGQESAADSELANRNARTLDGRPFWGPAEDAALPPSGRQKLRQQPQAGELPADSGPAAGKPKERAMRV